MDKLKIARSTHEAMPTREEEHITIDLLITRRVQDKIPVRADGARGSLGEAVDAYVNSVAYAGDIVGEVTIGISEPTFRKVYAAALADGELARRAV